MKQLNNFFWILIFIQFISINEGFSQILEFECECGDEINQLLISNDYVPLSLGLIDVALNIDIDNNAITEEAIILAGGFNVNNDVVDFFVPLSEGLSDVHAFIRSFESCDEAIAAFKENDELVTRNFDLPYIYMMDVVTTKRMNGSDILWVKITNTLENTNGGSNTIYVLQLEDSNLSGTSIDSYLSNFYSLLDISVDIEVVDHVDQDEIGDSDGLCIIGDKRSDIIGLVIGTYCKLHSSSFAETAMPDFLTDTRILEQGDPGPYGGKGIISYVDSGSLDSDAQDIFRANDAEHLAAFLVLHATGHNASIVHGAIGNQNEGYGYMAPARCIRWDLGTPGHQWMCHGTLSNPNFNPNPYPTLEALVEDVGDFIKDLVTDRWQ